MQNHAQTAPIDPRLANIARLLPHQINAVRLSKTQLKVLNAIRCGEQVTPEQISTRCDLSQSFASTLLKRLFEKAYIERRAESSQIGGLTYVYLKQWNTTPSDIIPL
ncbi:MarR family transcriptional regulator [Enterovibrio calviensis]|uniref:MarR family transcriptional regulator n=1 Tax=Enterovibrio calviensis TaxID=91359 RepID=UPI000688D1F4|nr:helix-turn-helix domain-containing protein [Enterovibrio calviensis]